MSAAWFHSIKIRQHDCDIVILWQARTLQQGCLQAAAKLQH
jgi:hypothetical protein